MAPDSDEMVVKNAAVAVNPVDVMIQDHGFLDYLTYPNILACDVAGTVVAVGSAIKEFQRGDRIISHAYGMDSGEPRHAGFQLYTTVKSSLTARLPPQISFEDGVVPPCCLSTAAAALFDPTALALTRPTISQGSNKKPESRGTILVWGGSSSVGGCATQLVHAAGYEVVVTASEENHNYCKALGAACTYDYRSEGVIETLSQLLRGKSFIGVLDSITDGAATEQCMQVVLGCGNGTKAKVVTTLPAQGRDGVDVVPVLAGTIADNGIGTWIYHDFLPQALENGTVKPKLAPRVLGSGLEAIQGAVDLMTEGLSATKIVVTL